MEQVQQDRRSRVKADRRGRVKVDKRKRTLKEKPKTDDEWKAEITECLNSKGNNVKWGCLSRGGSLFKIRTLDECAVPKRVVQSMEEDGLILITNKDTHYSFNKNKNEK